MLNMDVTARDGQVLRLTVHQTNAGHVELDNLLEVSQVFRNGDPTPIGAYSVRGFLSAADDDGTLSLDLEDNLVIERQWTVAIGDWLSMLAEGLDGGTPAHGPTAWTTAEPLAR